MRTRFRYSTNWKVSPSGLSWHRCVCVCNSDDDFGRTVVIYRGDGGVFEYQLAPGNTWAALGEVKSPLEAQRVVDTILSLEGLR